jgi:hypothetical protein
MSMTRQAGNFVFPGISQIVHEEAAKLGLDPADRLIETVKSSLPLRKISGHISSAATTHDPCAIPDILANGRAILSATILEITSMQAALVAAYDAAGFDPPDWLTGDPFRQTHAEDEVRDDRGDSGRDAGFATASGKLPSETQVTPLANPAETEPTEENTAPDGTLTLSDPPKKGK